MSDNTKVVNIPGVPPKSGTLDLSYFDISFPAHAFSSPVHSISSILIQFRPKKITAFKSKVQFRQIVIHIRFLSIKFNNSAFKFVNYCHWNSSLSLRVTNARIKFVILSNKFIILSFKFVRCYWAFTSGRRFWLKLWRKWMPIDEIAFAVSWSATVTDEFE